MKEFVKVVMVRWVIFVDNSVFEIEFKVKKLVVDDSKVKVVKI